MGTSGSSGGPNPRTPLVPSWLDDVAGPAAPGGGSVPPADTDSPTDTPQQSPQPIQPLPPIPAVPTPGRFTSARKNFTRFAKSGGSDGRALRRGVRDYVRSGTRGSQNAARRMGVSRAAAGGVLRTLRDFQRDGVSGTLTRLNLLQYAGRPLQEVFIGLTDVLWGDGGSIEEGIAREAWLETVAELDGLDALDPAALLPDQIRDIFLAFIAHSVVGRLLQEIGAKGFKFAENLAGIDAFEAQLKSYIRRSVRDSFSGDLTTPTALSDKQIGVIVNRTYEEAWDLLVTQGDAE